MNSPVKYQNPFRIEELRDRFARSRKYSEFRETYSDKYSEIKDLNKKLFWNEHMTSDGESLESNGVYKDKINTISNFLKTKKGKLLDIGFMWGNLEKKIEKFSNLKITGIDISDQAVKYAKLHFPGEYKVANIYKIPFKNDVFNFVIALDVLEHLRPSKVFKAYREMNRVLKRGGYIIVSVPTNEGLEEMVKNGKNPIGHLRTYTSKILMAELKLAGFKTLSVKRLHAFRSFYSLKKIIMKLLPSNFRKPNQLIIFARKIK